MAYTCNISRRSNGGYTVIWDGASSYPSEISYHGTETGVILFAKGFHMTRFYRPSEWTIQTVTGYTTVVQVADALDALGVLSSDTLEDIEALLTTIDADTGTLVTDVDAIKTAVEVMDDWDESNREKVNPIVGEAGVEAGAGTTTEKTQRVVQAKADYIDLSDSSGEIIYEGYWNGTNYDVCKITITDVLITREWATGDWGDRVLMFS